MNKIPRTLRLDQSENLSEKKFDKFRKNNKFEPI